MANCVTPNTLHLQISDPHPHFHVDVINVWPPRYFLWYGFFYFLEKITILLFEWNKPIIKILLKDISKGLIIWRISPRDEISSRLVGMKTETIISEFQPGVKSISVRDEINIENETSANIKSKARREIKWLPWCLKKHTKVSKRCHSHF